MTVPYAAAVVSGPALLDGLALLTPSPQMMSRCGCAREASTPPNGGVLLYPRTGVVSLLARLVRIARLTALHHTVGSPELAIFHALDISIHLVRAALLTPLPDLPSAAEDVTTWL